MHPIRATVEAYLVAGRSFQTRYIVRQTGFSRQVVNRHLKKMVVMEELTMFGEKRGVRYEAGPGFVRRPRGVDRGADDGDLWARLAEEVEPFAYVRLARMGRKLRTRDQARIALDGLDRKRFLVVDFREVEAVGEAFIQELFVARELEYSYRPEPINARAEVQDVIERVLRVQRLRNFNADRD